MKNIFSVLSDEELSQILNEEHGVYQLISEGQAANDPEFEDHLDVLVAELDSRGYSHGIGSRGNRHAGSAFVQVSESAIQPLADSVDLKGFILGANKGPKGVQ